MKNQLLNQFCNSFYIYTCVYYALTYLKKCFFNENSNILHTYKHNFILGSFHVFSNLQIHFPSLPFIFFHRPLDYENLVRHNLVITARDGGVPPLSSNLTLVVDVQDFNDNPPVFEHDSYAANVLESEAVSTKVCRCKIFIEQPSSKLILIPKITYLTYFPCP